MDRARRDWARWAVVALIVLRFVYISTDEIRAFPYDEAAYIFQAKMWYWGSGYNSWTYSRQPGFPLFAATAQLLGVPLRLAFEAVWIGAVLVVARACGRAGLRPSGRVLLIAMLLFHPFTTELFNRALADNLHTAAWLTFTAALACAAAAVGRGERRRWGSLASVAGVVAANCRQETVLVYALAAAAGAGLLAARRVSGRGDWALWRGRLLAGAVVPLAVAFLSVQAVNTANWLRIGAYAGYDWSTPGFKTLYRTLLSIPPETPRLRAPIPADVRRRAAEVSPMFARLLPIMETGERCAPFRRDGQLTTGIPGEPGSFNLWCLREAIWVVREDRIASAAEFDGVCWRVVGELRAAQARGELARRWAPMSFIPPEWGQLVRQMPAALPVCWRWMTRIGFEYRQLYPVSADAQQAFDEVALRRAALLELRRSPEGAGGARRGFAHNLDLTKRAVAGVWPAVSWGLLVCWVAGWGAAVWSRRRRALPREWWWLAVVLGVSLVLRAGLAAMLEATGIPLMHRYMFPAAALLVPAGVMGLRAVVAVVVKR